jgi:ABC-type multidrug transport system permease subunit
MTAGFFNNNIGMALSMVGISCTLPQKIGLDMARSSGEMYQALEQSATNSSTPPPPSIIISLFIFNILYFLLLFYCFFLAPLLLFLSPYYYLIGIFLIYISGIGGGISSDGPVPCACVGACRVCAFYFVF